MPHHAREGRHDLPALWIVSAHAAEPQAVLLGPVESRELLACDELLPLGRAHAQRVAVALQREKQLGSVFVFPLAGVHCAAPKPDDQRHMLDAHRTLMLAGAAGGALKRGLLREVLPQQRLLARGSKLIQVSAEAQRDFLGVENLSGVGGGAMLGAAAALDAGVRL